MALITIKQRNRRGAQSVAAQPLTVAHSPEKGVSVTINQRMLLVLLAAVAVLLLLLALQPTSKAGADNVFESPGDSTLLPESGGGAPGSPVDDGLAHMELNVISPVFTKEVRYWEANIVKWASDFEVDPNLVAIIMQVESCGDPQAVSIAGAQGLFQVMPFHFQPGENSLDPDTNARKGIGYFVERLAQTGGDIGRAYAGYNGGHVAAGSSWDYWANETQRYYIWTTGLVTDIQAGLDESPTLNQWLQAGGASLCQQAAEQLGL